MKEPELPNILGTFWFKMVHHPWHTLEGPIVVMGPTRSVTHYRGLWGSEGQTLHSCESMVWHCCWCFSSVIYFFLQCDLMMWLSLRPLAKKQWQKVKEEKLMRGIKTTTKTNSVVVFNFVISCQILGITNERQKNGDTASPRLSGWLGPAKFPIIAEKSQSLIIGIEVLRGIISKKSR